MINPYLVVILAILSFEYFIHTLAELLNLKNISFKLPVEFSNFCDEDLYKISIKYLKENTIFNLLKTTIFFFFTVFFILLGGFSWLDRFSRSFKFNYILTGLIFFAVVGVILEALNLPFRIYHTFVIEKKYGFSKTTVRTFILDHIKTWILSLVLGGIVLSIIIWFFSNIKGGWFYCWLIITGIQLFLTFLAPILILPLFNKFVPIEDGYLKESIENFAKSQNFPIKGIFKIDASRRSTKTNAYFVGFGKLRRIALYDTLIEKHTPEELVSILAHEIGHYKKAHIIKGMVISILYSGLLLFLASFFINNPVLFDAFKVKNLSVHASLVFFAFLYRPIDFVFSIFINIILRHFEFEADRFAVTEYKNPQAFILALKKLAVENLVNLNPHPLKVFLYYSHPPILERIRKINSLIAKNCRKN